MTHDNSEAASSRALTVVSRRAALRLAAVAALGVGVGASGVINPAATHWGRTPYAYQFFSEAEAKSLDRDLKQIIPRDDAPGATDVGVIFYIDRQLAGLLDRHQRQYRLGLASCAPDVSASLQGAI